ncbi:hypothetical protein NUU61_010212 [Penicillium alfredii]|uniref:Mitotic checkpoint regulator, MAD2B-interacting-domain-containing protein n=1 Tax=Penicillium alfredii TaxID=1506179 RepID=A0A9W9EHL5_9EURO|nr:uncharacterized protein NUU61_010212 [Penicillium alfredii]KAJ5081948.1 hypothetical protein NUU61_010212 [Penicillium alfredii]
MALVAYSDSEASDNEPESTPTLSADQTKKPDSGFRVDRSNPRKIRVALPELKPEPSADQNTDDGPARKKARVGPGAGGAFAGFNALLPTPKRTAEKKPPAASTRKVFSLKTGATPGFDRNADAEMKHDQAFDDTADDTLPAAGSLETSTTQADSTPDQKKTEPGEVKLQGNPMMFRPLSVARNQKKQRRKTTTQPTPSPSAAPTAQPPQPAATTPAPSTQTGASAAPAPPKPKVSLFSLGSAEKTAQTGNTPALSTTYEPLVYNTEEDGPSAGPTPAPEAISTALGSVSAGLSSNSTSLDTIADDLNLSRSERRQLFGRHAPPTSSQVRTFNTDEEYASNQVLAQGELAAAQHNPVRAIAPGKHTLQQLVNAASSQREALEESFASGRRNKREAGARYGW